MTHDRYRWQGWIVGIVLLVGFLPVGRQLVQWQVIHREELMPKASCNHPKKQVLEGYRGNILDANGEILVTSVLKKKVVADAALLSSLDLPANVAPMIVRKTAEVLGVSERHVWDRLGRNSQYVIIEPRVDEAVFNRLTNEISRLDFGVDPKQFQSKQRVALRQARQIAIYADEKDEPVRSYSEERCSQVLGYVDNNHKGVAGIELQFDSLLRAYDGVRTTERNAFGEALHIYTKDEVLPHDGLDVQTTIVRSVQRVLEEELKKAFVERQPDNAVGIVMRPRTGEILAMAAYPTFNPIEPGKRLPGETDMAAMDRLRNRCIIDMAEPGSTFKIVTVAGALDKGVVTLNDAFDCHMPWFFCGVPLRDSHPYGSLTVREIITKSSNIGAGKIAAMRLGQDGLYRYMKAFGFGERTGIQLPGEAAGIVHPPKEWSPISVAHIPMGHEVAVTPLQMVAAMSAIGNGGLRMQPMIVSCVRDRSGQVVGRFNPKPVCQVIRKQTADLMVEALTTVTEKGGTGTKGAVRGFDVAGKTGTAQKIEGSGSYEFQPLEFTGQFTTRALLDTLVTDGFTVQKASLEIESLNLLLKSDSVHQRFKGMVMPKNVVSLTRNVLSLKPRDLIKLNRVILETAYPHKCPKHQDGHYVQKYYSSFVGFFPARQPEVCILISLDNPHDPRGEYYGGAIAAPVFQAVAERVAKTLGIRPDRSEEEIATQTGRSKGRLNTAQHHAN
ncbi:MAG: penicillin-binding protein 2 [Verrucomicrobiia bacterium]|jgi:cell division protein FtsI (penicillin-binding protein 3)/stage V sporulation protein D (sporulation-specific penicillin-binding protein)